MLKAKPVGDGDSSVVKLSLLGPEFYTHISNSNAVT